ncbi:DNA-binding response regulator [Marinilabiliaceae bacterium JC017]|nr:DNA-binding response regulator [Marinilabiliaceae bacterium JC017]
MDPIKKLENEFSLVGLDQKGINSEELKASIQAVKSYVEIEQAVAVISDLAKNTSHIFVGSFGQFFGMTESGHKTINSIWEEEIYNRIHPDDLFERHLLELEFFNFLKQQNKNERLNYRTQCKIRALNRKNEYHYIKHQSFYLRMSEQGDLWLALCTYNYSSEVPPVNGINGQIVNKATGKAININTYKNCSSLLTSREREVLLNVEKGLLSKEIAHTLNISINTVNRHRQNILEKLKVNNSMEAVRTAKALNLLLP